jgi:hypothetical protein
LKGEKSQAICKAVRTGGRNTQPFGSLTVKENGIFAFKIVFYPLELFAVADNYNVQVLPRMTV